MASVFKRGGKSNRDGYWYVKWIDHNGKPCRRCTKTTDKAAASRIASKLEADTALRRDGVIDATADRLSIEGRRPIGDHIESYKNSLVAKGRDEYYTNRTLTRLRKILAQAAIGRITAISASAIESAIQELKATSGMGAAGVNNYIRTIKAFVGWLIQDRRLSTNPLVAIRRADEEADRRHVRRELTPAEITWLLSSAERYTSHQHSLTGPDRAIVYQVAFGTGFRVKELRSLSRESFQLESDPPAIILECTASKRRREDRQPIHKSLAEKLRDWLRDRPAGEKVFANLPNNCAGMVQRDLETARQAWLDTAATAAEREAREGSDFLKYENAAGEVFDFHATRHTYISSIVASGASVKVAQELARHSTPVLTIGRYAHTRLHDLKSALENLPANNPINPQEHHEMRATGTDGSSAHQTAHQTKHQTRRATVQISSTRCNAVKEERDTDDERKPVRGAMLCNAKASNSAAINTGLEPDHFSTEIHTMCPTALRQ